MVAPAHSCVDGISNQLRHELRCPTVEAPPAAGVVEEVAIAPDELNRPAVLAFQDEDHVAGARASSSFQSVTWVLMTRWRCGRRGFHAAKALRRASWPSWSHPWDLAGAVGAEGGDDVVGPTIVQGLGVLGHGGADPLDDLA